MLEQLEGFGRVCRAKGPVGCGLLEQNKIGDWRERFANLSNIFVGQNRQNQRRALVAQNSRARFARALCADGLWAPSMIVRSSQR